MGALVVIGVVLILSIAVAGDVISKAIKSRNLFMPKEIKALQDRILKLEAEARERDIATGNAIGKLQEDQAFTTRMLEDRSKQ